MAKGMLPVMSEELHPLGEVFAIEMAVDVDGCPDARVTSEKLGQGDVALRRPKEFRYGGMPQLVHRKVTDFGTPEAGSPPAVHR